MTTKQTAEKLKGHLERAMEWKEEDLREKVERFIEGVKRIDTGNIMRGSWEIAGLHSEIQAIEDLYHNIREDYARLKTLNRIIENNE